METLTFKQFARRYGMGDQRAREWIESGTAPGRKIGNRYLIPVIWCDAYDRGESGPWERATPPEPVVTSPYLRRVS